MNIMVPSHPNVTIEDVSKMPEEQWLKLVGELAFPERASTMMLASKLAIDRGVTHIVETGCIRGCAGDGQSTLIFAMLAVRMKAKFETFDISEVHVSNAQKWIGSFCDFVMFRTGDSVAGLSRLKGSVGLVYLDSYDYDANNPRPCQLHQLAEVGAIYGKLTDNAVLVMDDAGLLGGGKVEMAVDFLKARGWKEHTRDYQVVMTRT